MYSLDIPDFKQEVLKRLSGFIGWCSNEKATYLMDFVLQNKPTTAVEIGVYGGKSLAPVAFAMKYNGFGKIYGIDPWLVEESCKGMEGLDLDYWSRVNHNGILHHLQINLRQFELSEYARLIRVTSQDCPPIHDIDIIHIDGNHSEDSSYHDVRKWAPLVKPGGLIIFDDIDWKTTEKAAAWLDETCEKVGLVEGHKNVWGIWKKK